VITVFEKYQIHFEYRKKEGANKTAIMVNGALATTTSFSQSIRNLEDHVNIVLFDLPFAGRSREHNTNTSAVLSKDDEVEILLYLIEHFGVNFMISASWGGVSSLLSLARRPSTIERRSSSHFPQSSTTLCTAIWSMLAVSCAIRIFRVERSC